MKVFFKWSLFVLLAFVGILLSYMGYIAIQFNQSFEPVSRNFVVAGNTDLGEGERLARIAGCYGACHGADAGGRDFYGVYASNLTKIVHQYNDDELEQTIRQGISPTGKSLRMMPSSMYQYLSDEHLSQIIAFLRSLPVIDKPVKGEVAMMGLVPYLNYFFFGDFVIVAKYSQDEVPPKVTPVEAAARGKYLALTTCSECHGSTLQGFAEFSPSLSIVKGYTYEQFKTLLTTGIALGDREVGIMTSVSKGRFVHFREDEMQALYDHLIARDFLTTAALD